MLKRVMPERNFSVLHFQTSEFRHIFTTKKVSCEYLHETDNCCILKNVYLHISEKLQQNIIRDILQHIF